MKVARKARRIAADYHAIGDGQSLALLMVASTVVLELPKNSARPYQTSSKRKEAEQAKAQGRVVNNASGLSLPASTPPTLLSLIAQTLLDVADLCTAIVTHNTCYTTTSAAT